MHAAFQVEAEAELAVGFFGSRYERATPGEREYLRAMADVAADAAATDPGGVPSLETVESVPTADVAAHLLALADPGARR